MSKIECPQQQLGALRDLIVGSLSENGGNCNGIGVFDQSCRMQSPDGKRMVCLKAGPEGGAFCSQLPEASRLAVKNLLLQTIQSLPQAKSA
ncbi:MAG: hypothetical protein V1936_02415 [Patescibacteria group bacterium]